MLNPERVRSEFPIFRSYEARNEPFIYLDNAATTQKPKAVIQAESDFYEKSCANIHRSPHKIGVEATEQFEAARGKVAAFLGTSDVGEIIFTRGTTEGINLVSGILAGQLLQPGDVILLTLAEHHSNLIPWQMAAKRSGATLEFVKLHAPGVLDVEEIEANWNPRTKVFAFQHASNVLGTIHPVKELCRIARANGAISVIDGAQAAPHVPVNVKEIDCDFYAFSGHKVVGPTGIGALYGRRALLEKFDPIFGGGEMILKVSPTSATYNVIPYKFEPGTPNIAGAIGLGAALDYLMSVGMENIDSYLAELTSKAIERMGQVKGLTIHGPVKGRTGAISFWLDGCHPHDIASILDTFGIAVRAGHHCAQPLMKWLDVPATARAAFYIYNTESEIESLATALERARKVLGHDD
jgi:cysteine desulfurase/selenocysteine lyase